MGKKRSAGMAAAVAGSLLLAACGSSSSSSSSNTTAAGSGSTSATTAPAATAVGINSFTSDFSAMAGLKSLAAKGKGNVAVLLPDTQSSARYVSFDQPYLTKAFEAAGLSSSQISVENAQGSAQTQTTQAEQAITNGATVIVLDSLDSGTGAGIEKSAQAKGVAVIDYDRVNLNGSASYYVSFDNVKVGVLQGQGLQACVQSWNVASPQVFELDGSPTDNNATQFAQGYNSVLSPLYAAGTFKKVGEQAVPDWSLTQGQTIFQQQYQAHSNINAVLTANDGLAGSVISVLKQLNIGPKKVPTTGQDASLVGLQNILAGYQCMTVYKPIYQEAQATAAVALYLRAGQRPPSSLINGQTNIQTATPVPSVLLTPVSVTTANMNGTVVKDQFVQASALCAGYTTQCTAAGISG
jgi:D-xylose transport system substrate-binding protein